jgi:hypothetical protein
MERLKIPKSYIDMIMYVTTSRRTKALTAYCETEAFNPKRGIEQGECNAPLLWNILYNPLLSRLQTLNAGYHLTHSPHQSVDVTDKTADVFLDPGILKTHDYLAVPEHPKINNVAFMDDLALISGDTEAMKNLLCETVSFLDIQGIALNAAKTFSKDEFRKMIIWL